VKAIFFDKNPIQQVKADIPLAYRQVYPLTLLAHNLIPLRGSSARI